MSKRKSTNSLGIYWGTLEETWKEPDLLAYYQEMLKFKQELMYINMNKNTRYYHLSTVLRV